ncbi:hypothetical protein ES705_24794 [subsurface metagenome]
MKNLNEKEPLNDFEKSLIQPFQNSFKNHVGKEKAVTYNEIDRWIKKRYGKTIGESRVRKIINHLRCSGFVHRLIASSDGYYVETNDEELRKYIHSLEESAGAIKAVADVLKIQLNDK